MALTLDHQFPGWKVIDGDQTIRAFFKMEVRVRPSHRFDIHGSKNRDHWKKGDLIQFLNEDKKVCVTATMDDYEAKTHPLALPGDPRPKGYFYLSNICIDGVPL